MTTLKTTESVRRITLWAGVASLLLIVTGCAGSGLSAATGPGIRAVNGLNNVTQAVVLDGSYVVSPGLPYGTVSGTPNIPYEIVPLGPQTVTVANAAAPSTLLDSVPLTVGNSGFHIDEIFYNPAKPTALSLVDSFSVPATANVRFANASAAAGTVDVIITPPNGAAASVKFTMTPGQCGPLQPAGSYSYASFPVTGPYFIQIFPTGHDTGAPLLSQNVNLTLGASFTYVLLDPANGNPFVLLGVQDNQLYDSAP